MKLEIFQFLEKSIEHMDNNIEFINTSSDALKKFFNDIFLNCDFFINTTARIKSEDSIREKLLRNNYYYKYPNHKVAIENLPDLIGIRVECRFIDDEKKLLKFPIKSLKSTLLNVPFCTIPESQELIANYCKTLFISTNPLSISTSKSTALQWALENRAIVFAPLSPGEPVPGDLKVYILPSDMFRCYRFLYTLKNRELSPITQKFVDFLIDQHFKEGHYHSSLNILNNI